MPNFIKLVISISFTLGVGFLGSLATTPAIDSWYKTLEKPFFNPPNWIFAPVWTLLYVLMAIAFYLIWISGKKIKKPAILYVIQLFLNLFWSILFFGLKIPSVALLEIIILWIFIVLTAQSFYKINRLASYLLIPYLAWVSFAALLNYFLVLLN